jgi:RNA polymerase sigma-70 factor (family 1)
MQALLDRIAHDDDQLAFRQVFLHYSDRLILFAAAFLQTKEEGEEVVADVFIKLWQHRRQLPEIRNINTYLYTAVRNTALNYLGKRQRASGLPYISVVADAGAVSPEDILISKENLQRVEEAVNGLPPRCRLIFRLIREDGLRYKEVAEILGISVNTVNVQMGIAMKKLTQVIDARQRSGFIY